MQGFSIGNLNACRMYLRSVQIYKTIPNKKTAFYILQRSGLNILL